MSSAQLRPAPLLTEATRPGEFARAKSPIQVLHLITGLGLGGAETMLYKLLAATDRQRYPSRVLSLRGVDVLTPRIESLGVEVTSLDMKRGTLDVRALQALHAQLHNAQPTIVQTWMYHANILGLVAARASVRTKVVWNIRCSDLNFKTAPIGLRAVFRAHGLLSRFADAIVVNSAAGMHFHQESGHHAKQWELIQNGFDAEKFRPDEALRHQVRAELSIMPNAVAIGMLARFDTFKDHRTFIEAAGLLRSTHRDVVFVLAGRGVSLENPVIRSYVDAAGGASQMRLLGEYSEPARLLAALDVGTLCSVTEGFPNALGEAMSAGLPCVATDVGDCASLLADTGFTVPVHDARALADRWRELIELGTAERTRIGLAARSRIQEHFSMRRIAAAYEELYSKLASAG